MRGRLIWIAALVCGGLAMVSVPAQPGSIDYRGEMIAFVGRIAERARLRKPDFGVFPQNGADLGQSAAYLQTVTGIGQEDVYFGYQRDGKATPAPVTQALETALDRFTAAERLVLTIDYPFPNPNRPTFSRATRKKIDTAYSRSQAKGYVPYTTVRNLNFLTKNPGHLPTPNTPPITEWSQVKEFGYQLQPRPRNGQAFLDAIGRSGFDLFVTDYSSDGNKSGEYTPKQIAGAKAQLGGKLVAYMSIGEAEDYRFYWKRAWDRNRDGRPDRGAPTWLGRENPNWKGNYKVRYWDPAWQTVIFGYLDRILDQGFDGVYLDIIDAYEYWER